MNNIDVRSLNDDFAVADHVSFAVGPGGLPVAEIGNAHASATVALLGGHVLGFRPHGHEPVLWLSRHSHFEVGRPIRGGIPVCWPWFSSHPTDKSKPFHGFVRTAVWSVRSTDAVPDGSTRIRLGITDNEGTQALWPHAFDLEIAVTVGPGLQVQLIMRNTGQQPWTCTGALHHYFNVGDVTDIAIHGLDGCRYLEKSPEPQLQEGPVTIGCEVDRVYLDTAADCVIEDPGLGRRIRVARSGSRSTVVWNPWAEKSRLLEDFGDDEYKSMVCVETTNARQDPVTVPPGGEHILGAVIGVERS